MISTPSAEVLPFALESQAKGFLRSLGFEAPRALETLAPKLFAGLDLGEGNAREAFEKRVAEWLAPHFDPMPRDRLFAMARLAFLGSGAAERWADAFLSEVPAEMVKALRAALPVSTPAEALSAMPEQSLAPAQWIVQLGQLWSPQAQGSWNS